MEDLLTSEDHVLDVGYDKYFKCWTCHLVFPCTEEGPHKGYSDGCEGRGDTPTAAIEACYEVFLKHGEEDGESESA